MDALKCSLLLEEEEDEEIILLHSTIGKMMQFSDTETKKTQTVNIEDSSFTVDGVYAEMIIEVDDNPMNSDFSPLKQIRESLTPTTESEDLTSSRRECSEFVRNLGLGEVMPVHKGTEAKKKNIEEKVSQIKTEPVSEGSSPKRPKLNSKNVTKKRRSGRLHIQKEIQVPAKKSTRDEEPVTKKKKKEQEDYPKVLLRNLDVGSQIHGRGLRLTNIPRVYDGLVRVSEPVLKLLYQLIYNQNPPSDIENARLQILQFRGFTFNSNSSLYAKKKSQLEKFYFEQLKKICCVFGLKICSSEEMVENILNFMLKPVVKLDPSVDIEFQPYVLLHKIDIADVERRKNLSRMSTTRRKGMPTRQLKQEQSTEDDSSTVTTSKKNLKRSLPTKTTKVETVMKDTESSDQPKQLETIHNVEEKIKEKKNTTTTRKSTSRLRRSPARYRNDDDDEDTLQKGDMDIDNDIKLLKLQENAAEEKTSKDDTDDEIVVISDEHSNEETDSNTEEVTENSEKKPVNHQGVRLGSFPQIAQSIKNTTDCILQRLHVILFGTSLRPELMKRNILDFDGFPFGETSDQWAQKHFFLSLSACNNLLEVFDILHIEVKDDSPNGMVDTLMKFLVEPKEELLKKDVMDKVIVKTLDKDKVNIKTSSKDKVNRKTSSKDKVKRKTSSKVKAALLKAKKPKHRKVLMSEEEFKKMSSDFERAQRIRKRDNLKQVSSVPGTNSYPLLAPKVSGVAYPSSLPKDGRKLRLDDSMHIRFMIVALSYFDLDVIHHILYLHSAAKTRIRRSILDFDGFDFDSNSDRYQVRKIILIRLGERMVKRLAFILGLAPLDTRRHIDSLAESIMQFLMAPNCRKNIIVTELPENFLQDLPFEFNKKIIFSNIPQLRKVLHEEFGEIPSCNIIVKNVGNSAKDDTAKANDIPPSGAGPSKAKKLPAVAPKIKPAVTATSPPTLYAVRTGDGPSASYHIVAKSPASGKEQGNVGPSSKQIILKSVPHSVPGMSSSFIVPGIHALPPGTMVQQKPLPPGQAFLLDPSKLVMMSKDLQKPTLTTIPISNQMSTSAKPLIPGTSIPPQQQKQLSITLKSPNLPSKGKTPSNKPPDSAVVQATSIASPVPQTILIQTPSMGRTQTNIVSPSSTSSPTPQQTYVLVPSTPTSSSQVHTMVLQAPQVASTSSAVLMTTTKQIVSTKPLTSQQIAQQIGGNVDGKKVTLVKLPMNHPFLQSMKPAMKVDPPKPRPTLSSPKTIPQFRTIAPNLPISKPTVASHLHGVDASVASNTSENTLSPLVPVMPEDSGETILPDDGPHAEEEERNEPSDDRLFEMIRDMIHSADLTKLTLKGIIDKLLNAYPSLDVAAKRPFIRDTVRNIICGTKPDG